MKILNPQFSHQTHSIGTGSVQTLGNYFRQKTIKLMAIILICVVIFYLSGFLNKGVDHLRKIAPTALKQLNADD